MGTLSRGAEEMKTPYEVIEAFLGRNLTASRMQSLKAMLRCAILKIRQE